MKTLTIAALAAAAAYPAAAQAGPLDLREPMEIAAPAPVFNSCQAQTVMVYFAPGETELSAQAAAAVDAAAASLKACTVSEIRTLALSEDAFEVDDRLALSDARAEAVLAAFDAAGVRAAKTGSGLVVRTESYREDEAHEPIARRVEVRLTASRGPAIS